MTVTTTAPMKRALVRKIRAIPGFGAASPGGLHQGLAPKKAKYPFLTYNFLPASRSYQFGGGNQIGALVDIFAFHVNSVGAENLDSLVAAGISDAYFTVDGQELLLLRRVADLSQGPTVDARGRRIFQIGGTYRFITDQNP